MEKKQDTKFSILMFPWLSYSHVSPFLQLAKALSTKNFHIYFCTSPINLDIIKSETRSSDGDYPLIEFVELHVPPSPQLPPHLHTTKNLPSNLIPALIHSFQRSATSFSEILTALKPDLLIYDFFQPWAPKLAISQNIPAVYFATSGVAPFSFFHHLHTHGSTKPFPYREIYLKEHEKVELRRSQANPPTVRDADENYFAFGNLEMSSEVVLVKSSRAIDGHYIDYLSELCGKKVVPVGPLVGGANREKDDNGGVEILMEWLGEKDPLSTVLVCFGSENALSDEQVGEVAGGLELSPANFVWVVRPETKLPEGFLKRVDGRGVVLRGWAPQGEILGHPSVAGFVSHCGWSSVMESLWFGIPIVALPIKYDQPINGRLVESAGAGVEVERDGSGGFVGDRVARAIKEAILGKSGEDMRVAARSLSERLRGDAERATDEVARVLFELCNKSKSNARP